jgi:hypothetical protein
MGDFNAGLSVLESGFVDRHLDKHEACHLLGYMRHDDFPLFVVGYPWEGSPWTRDTLMVLNGVNETLSPRSRDAMHYFWLGMEKRLQMKFLRDGDKLAG